MVPIPPDMSEKEKVVGGFLTFNQLFWIIGGLLIGGLVFAVTFIAINGQLALVFGLVSSLVGLPFAFYKKKELTLYQIIYYKHKNKKKTKKMKNINKPIIF